ncbi:MAG: hypothetical protein IJ221_03035 [Oscillibacter sp.]|nr:hypothetical protein [Oscillibacter sp.]
MDEAFREVLTRHHLRYPRMEPQDWGKLAYQSEFGPAHFGLEEGAVRRALTQEWQAVEDAPPRPPEPIGNGLCRFHLTERSDIGDAAPLLTELFLRTAREHRGTMEGLAARLSALEELDVPGLSPWLVSYRAAGCPAVHHSDAYRAAYRPHYRLLREVYADCFPVLLAVHRLLRQKGGGVVAIDGRCGSGKTGLAALLEDLFPCRVFHMDDYYLPPADRAENWTELPAGNMDLDRFLAEVLLPAREGRAVMYRAYDCQHGALSAPETVPPRSLTVVEGSYSHHPRLAPYYDGTVFLTCGEAVRLDRLRRREGADIRAFQERWIPMEERYFRTYGIEERSALRLDTTLFPEGLL